MGFKIIIFTLFFIIPMKSYAQSAQQIMVISKMSGACGVLNSMIDFQEKTKMPGGDEFVVRFWNTEAARLGMSIEELSEKCNFSISNYDVFFKGLENLGDE